MHSALAGFISLEESFRLDARCTAPLKPCELTYGWKKVGVAASGLPRRAALSTSLTTLSLFITCRYSAPSHLPLTLTA